MAEGSVYFVRAEMLGLIKIGHSADVASRISVMRAQSPDRLVLLGTIESHDARSLEVELMARFAAHRSHGEWFHPAPEIVAHIRDHAEPPFDTSRFSVAHREVFGDKLDEWLALQYATAAAPRSARLLENEEVARWAG
jgi:hypothetical protein